MDRLLKIAGQIELHSVEGIERYFAEGISPNDFYEGEPLIYDLTSEYTRSPRFKDCVRVFIDHGLKFDDRALLSVLADDPVTLGSLLTREPRISSIKYTLRCAYTPLYEVSLLHICAEFNHIACARVLIQHGVDVNVRAGIDKHGFGGQTPIFHTVNQNNNQSVDMLDYLLTLPADLSITIPGLIWGKGYDWETLIPAVNPISYCIMGLLPQMHRDELTISRIVSILIKHQYGIEYTPENVPCKYLRKGDR